MSLEKSANFPPDFVTHVWEILMPVFCDGDTVGRDAEFVGGVASRETPLGRRRRRLPLNGIVPWPSSSRGGRAYSTDRPGADCNCIINGAYITILLNRTQLQSASPTLSEWMYLPRAHLLRRTKRVSASTCSCTDCSLPYKLVVFILQAVTRTQFGHKLRAAMTVS